MFLFIFESIGTSELILIGIVALIFLGPRRMPEIARKVGKMMAEFRGTANEFKETWQREVDFEEETKALRIDLIDEEPPQIRPVAREISSTSAVAAAETPSIRSIDNEQYEALRKMTSHSSEPAIDDSETAIDTEPDLLSDKRNWL